MFSTLMTPARFTAAVPLNPKLIPKAPMLSLLFAVTATPRKVVSTPFVISRGPRALASPDGVFPDGAMLCDFPLAAAVRGIVVGVPALPGLPSSLPSAPLSQMPFAP